MKSKSILLLAFIFTVCIAVNPLVYNAAQSVLPANRPLATFAPPAAKTGTVDSVGVADSFNGWQSRNLMINNTLATCQSPSRNTDFTQDPPTGSGITTAWQNLSVSKLTAVPDLREVQYATTSLSHFLSVKKGVSTNNQAGMRFNLVDAVNLTSVWIYYSSDDANAMLQIVSKGTTASDTPQGGALVATCTMPLMATASWREVKFSQSVSLTKGNYYWAIVNASNMNPSKVVQWYYVNDTNGMDQKPAAVYTTSWQNEIYLNSTLHLSYLNLALVLKVLPVVSGNPSKVMTYSSPGQVNMTERNSGTLMSMNSTRIPTNIHKFMLCANTSVTLAENWTARFECQVSHAITTYMTYPGLSYWNVSFFSEYRPYNSYTWYNRTIKVSPILYWQIDPVNNVTNSENINFTASLSSDGGYFFIRQTDNVNETIIWHAEWTITAKSPYSITASTPSQVIAGQRFDINITVPLTPTNCNITIYDNSTDLVVLSRSVNLTSSPCYFSLGLNKSGYFVITFFNELDNAPEVSYVVLPTINCVDAQTSLELQSSTMQASYGDIISIAFRYRNTTLGSDKEFPTSPDVEVGTESGNITIGNIESTGDGWFSFRFETRRLNSSGGYVLTIQVSYGGLYYNQKTMTLQLDPPGISPAMLVLAGGGSAGVVIGVVAARKYLVARRAKDEEKVKILRQTASLAQLVVLHIGSGVCAYSRNLGTEQNVDPDLIAGFLSANQSIMTQVFRGKATSGLRFADYGEYKVISHVGKYVMSSLFCTEAAGEELKSVLEQFTKEFEKKYEKELAAWDGNSSLFSGADKIADKVFSLRLVSPYVLELDRLAKVSLSGIERAVVDSARRLSAVRGIFFMPRIIDFLLTNKKAKKGRIVDIIDSLVKKRVFKQLTVEEASVIISQSEYDSKSSADAIADLLNGSG